MIHDEAQQELWAGDTQTAGLTLAEPGICLVTWQPDSLPDELRRSVGVSVTVTGPPSAGPPGLSSLHASLQLAGEDPRPFRVGERVSPHVRHRHKYATAPLPTHRRFYFHHADGEAQAAAATLEEFSRHLRHCELATLDYHLARGDFSRWIVGTLADHDLGAGLAAVERDVSLHRAGELEPARHEIVDGIERRYLQHRET